MNIFEHKLTLGSRTVATGETELEQKPGKLHKPDVPSCPILVSKGLPIYNYAQHLAQIFKPPVGNTSHSILKSSLIK